MLPLRDNVPSRRFPAVNLIIIAINIAVFFYELSLGRGLENFFLQVGIVPQRFSTALEMHDPSLLLGSVSTLFSYMFLHGGWMHIIGNLWILWIFGDNVEEHLGHIRYLFFYLAMGVFAGLFHMFTEPHSTLPTVGASGAIAGVMGGYFILYPRARVLTLVPIFIFIQLIELPAFIFLGIWFLIQFLMGTQGSMHGAEQGGVAWWAHIGGFVAGVLGVHLFASRRFSSGRR